MRASCAYSAGMRTVTGLPPGTSGSSGRPTRSPVRAPARGYPRGARKASHFDRRSYLVLGLVAVLVVTGLAASYLIFDNPPPPRARLIYALTATTAEGFPTLPAGLLDQADSMVAAGPTDFQVSVGAGTAAVTSLVALDQNVDGGRENDAQARASEVKKAVAKTMAAADPLASTLPGGRSLLNLINTISGSLGPGANVIYLATIGLPTASGEDVRLLMNTDPAQAADSLPGNAISSLHGVDVHLLLLPNAGIQPPVTAATDNWRKAFVLAVLSRAHAGNVITSNDNQVEPSMPGAPTAPPVPNLQLQTKIPVTTTSEPTVKLDTAAIFLPDSAQFATNQASIQADLQPVVTAWTHALKQGRRLVITVQGHCARFGPRTGAITLSRQRAQAIAVVLTAMDVPVKADQVTGTGFDDPLPDPQHPQSSANRAVVVSIHS